MTARLAHPRLRPFVATVWVSEAAPGAPLDRMLPSASPHLVFRLAADRSGGTDVVGGPRGTAYLRTPASAGRTVGAVLQPGVTHLLFDAHGIDLTERHIEVANLWGAAATDALAERLAAAPTPAAALDAFGHAELDFGGTTVMLADEFPEYDSCGPQTHGGTSVTIHLHVDDTDAVVARAVEAGAEVLMPPADQFYGERSGVVRDPFGHQWNTGHHIEEVSPEEMQRRYDNDGA